MTEKIQSRRHGMTAELAEASAKARAEGLRVADSSTSATGSPPLAGPTTFERHFERPIGPSVACAADLAATPLHRPPEGYVWHSLYQGTSDDA